MHEKRFHRDADRLRAPERIERLEVERVIELCLEGITPESVLDEGCGSGLFSEAFAGRGLRVTGLDANPEMLQIASRYLPQAEFREAIAESIPFDDDTFDLVFMGVVLHETDDTRQALREARRVAKMRVSILEWPYMEEAYGPPLAHRLKPEDVAAMAREAGFKEAETIMLQNTVFYRLAV